MPSEINVPYEPFGKIKKCTPWKIEGLCSKIINFCLIWALFQQIFVIFQNIINMLCKIRALPLEQSLEINEHTVGVLLAQVPQVPWHPLILDHAFWNQLM